MLAQITNATDALELGTFTGYSAICIARGLAPNGHLTCLELEQRFADIAQANLDDAGVADRATIEVGPADAWLERQPETERFDFVFLDADKSGYPAYYELLLPRMKPGALLLIDNTLMDGRVVDPQDDATKAVAELNDAIAADERVDTAMALVADGLTFVRKR